MVFDSLAALVAPPVFKEGSSYQNYKKELQIWQKLKTCAAEEQGPVIFRSFPDGGRAKIAALQLTVDEISNGKDGKTGLDLILDKLDQLYDTDENQKTLSALEKFDKT